MVLVRSENGQLLMIPQQALAQMQAQAHVQTQPQTTMAPRPATPTSAPPVQISTVQVSARVLGGGSPWGVWQVFCEGREGRPRATHRREALWSWLCVRTQRNSGLVAWTLSCLFPPLPDSPPVPQSPLLQSEPCVPWLLLLGRLLSSGDCVKRHPSPPHMRLGLWGLAQGSLPGDQGGERSPSAGVLRPHPSFRSYVCQHTTRVSSVSRCLNSVVLTGWPVSN